MVHPIRTITFKPGFSVRQQLEGLLPLPLGWLRALIAIPLSYVAVNILFLPGDPAISAIGWWMEGGILLTAFFALYKICESLFRLFSRNVEGYQLVIQRNEHGVLEGTVVRYDDVQDLTREIGLHLRIPVKLHSSETCYFRVGSTPLMGWFVTAFNLDDHLVEIQLKDQTGKKEPYRYLERLFEDMEKAHAHRAYSFDAFNAIRPAARQASKNALHSLN